jgi:glycosyltransferase involved in cell wall biosynthesis
MSVYYRALVMARKGVEIDLLTYGEGQDVNIPGVRIVRTPRFAFLGGVKIGPSLLKIFLDMFITFQTIGLLIRHRYDFVHAHEEAAFMAIVLRPIFRFKLIYDMHSSLPEQLNNFGWSKSKVLRRLITSAENSTLQRADALITICPALADYATSRIADTGKHFLIENSIFEPVNLIEKNESNGAVVNVSSVFDELKSSGATAIVVYAGTLEAYQGIDLLLNSMVSVKCKDDSIRLIVVGGSREQVAYYTAMAQKLGVNDVCLFFSRVPQATARNFAAEADVLVSPRTRGMNTPLKIYEQLYSGKPLVATRISSHTQVLNEDVAFLADPQPSAFAEQIVLAASDAGLAADKVSCARKHYEESYSPAVYAEKIDRLLDLID